MLNKIQREVAIILIKRCRRERESRKKLDDLGVKLEISSVYDVVLDALATIIAPNEFWDDVFDYLALHIDGKLTPDKLLKSTIKYYELKRKQRSLDRA